MAKIVWVLGAGFSRSLGGPLLTQLFSEKSQLDVLTAFPSADFSELFSPEAKLVRSVYAQHKAGRWQDAEEFLDYLDTARSKGPGTHAREVIRQLVVQTPYGSNWKDITVETIDKMATASQRLLAAECSAFLKDAEPTSERWAPYHRWAAELAGEDTVITFNYDLVVEKLANMTPELRAKLRFPLTGLGLEDQSRVRILKLHGSVNWCKEATPVPDVFKLFVTDDEYFALRCPEQCLTIGTPGPTKFNATAGGVLEQVWNVAMDALSGADAIVLVGYRFPESDSAARRLLVEAIGKNTKRQLALHTVLGPSTESDASRRLESILKTAANKKARNWLASPPEQPIPYGPTDTRLWYSLTQWPLYAQDFLDLYERDQLTSVA